MCCCCTQSCQGSVCTATHLVPHLLQRLPLLPPVGGCQALLHLLGQASLCSKGGCSCGQPVLQLLDLLLQAPTLLLHLLQGCLCLFQSAHLLQAPME